MTNITTEDGDKAVFEYFPATTKADVAKDRARITVTDEEGDVTELNLQLNSDGYVEFCNSIDHAGKLLMPMSLLGRWNTTLKAIWL